MLFVSNRPVMLVKAKKKTSKSPAEWRG